MLCMVPINSFSCVCLASSLHLHFILLRCGGGLGHWEGIVRQTSEAQLLRSLSSLSFLCPQAIYLRLQRDALRCVPVFFRDQHRSHQQEYWLTLRIRFFSSTMPMPVPTPVLIHHSIITQGKSMPQSSQPSACAVPFQELKVPDACKHLLCCAPSCNRH